MGYLTARVFFSYPLLKRPMHLFTFLTLWLELLPPSVCLAPPWRFHDCFFFQSRILRSERNSLPTVHPLIFLLFSPRYIMQTWSSRIKFNRLNNSSLDLKSVKFSFLKFFFFFFWVNKRDNRDNRILAIPDCEFEVSHLSPSVSCCHGGLGPFSLACIVFY